MNRTDSSETSPLLRNEVGSHNTYLDSGGISEQPASDNNSNSSIRWTTSQKWTAVSIAFMNIALALSFSVIAPFFPKEAEKKGADSTIVGLIFGVFELVIFITAPIYGTLISRFGAKRMFLSGTFLCGGCNILFGFLDECPDGIVYIVMCFVCRSIEANGASMGLTASFAIMAKQFPENVAVALGTLETFSGLGMVLGPSLGGGLYALGGYKTPFIVVGSIVLACTLLTTFTMPEVVDVTPLKGKFIDLLMIPGCVVVYFVIIGCALALSFLDPTFSPYLQSKFPSLSIGTIGLIFMTAPGSYAISAPLFGWLSDKGWQVSLVVVGMILNGCGFLFIGPSPMLSFIPVTMAEVIIPLLVIGITVGMALLPLFPLILKHTSYYGYDETSLQTFGLVSGFFNSGFALGAFVGPTAAGYFDKKFGFEMAMSVCGFVIIAMGLLMGLYVLIMKCLGKWPLPIPVKEEEIKGDESNNTAAIQA